MRRESNEWRPRLLTMMMPVQMNAVRTQRSVRAVARKGGALRFGVSAIVLAHVVLGSVVVGATREVEAPLPLQSTPVASHSAIAGLNRAAVARLTQSQTTALLRLTLNPAGNQRLVLTMDRRQWLEPGRVVWHGRVEGHLGSHVMLAVSGEAVAGSVYVPGRDTIQIQSGGPGVIRMVSVDRLHFPSCATKKRPLAVKPEPWTEESTFQVAGGPGTPTNTVIDLLLVYTAAARDGAGGVDGMNALIDVAVAEANLAFENSLVRAELRLVHRAEVGYRESGDINEDLDRLEDPDDGTPLALAHDWRGQYRADLVCMITETTGGPYGLANQMRENEVEFGDKAFSIVQRQYAISYQAFAHELGHNMGCQHDRETSPTGGVHDYSHAHRFEVDGTIYHTVMAYAPGLPIPYFSNPNVSFLGQPTGIAEPATNSANNAKTLNRTVATVAQFDSRVRFGQPPRVALETPTNGTTILVPAILELRAVASDPDGAVVKVEFFVNGTRFKTLTAPPYSLWWTNGTPGTYSFRVQATDDTGWAVYSPRAFVTLTLPDPVIDLPGCHALPSGAFQLRVRGVDGQAFRLEISEDLVGWNFLTTDSLIGETMDYADDSATNSLRRFYRVLPVP